MVIVIGLDFAFPSSGGWSFGAVGSLEGAYVIFKSGALTSFSAQQVISCDTGNTGCDGG